MMATPTLIHGIASSQVLDSSGERIDIANLDISSYRQGKGTLNFEHESKLPQQNVGKIIYAKKIMTPEECSNEAQKKFWGIAKSPYVYVIGELFDSEGEHDAAKAIAAVFKHDFEKSKKDDKHEYVYGFSVEGQTLEKKGSEIVASVARDLTITKKPCNKTCIAEIYVPEADASEEDPLEFLKSEPETYNLFKTLTAGGSNATPSSLKGGASLASEQIDDKLYGQIKNFISRRVKGSDKDKEGVSKALYQRILSKAEDAMESLFKSSSLEKTSWNVREQRKRIFGESGEPSPDKKTTKPYFQAQTEALNRLAQKRYGLPLVGSKGKFQYTLKQINKMRAKKGEAPLTLDEVASHPDYELANTNVSSKKDFNQIRLKDQKSNPKPDWRGFDGGIETQRHIGAKAHEMGHLDIAPAGLGIGDIQHDMDEGSKIAGGQYGGSAKQIELEIQPMAAEERLRRRAGIPQFGRPQYTDPTRGKSSELITEKSPERVSLDTGRKYARRETDPSGQIYDRIGMGSNLTPENKQRMDDIDQGIVGFTPEKGWQPSLSSNALINLRAQGRPDEAKQRLKQKFAKNEKKPEPKLPYSQQQWYKMPIRQKKQAMAALEREKKGIKTPSIHEIFTQDVIDSIVNKHKQKPNG